MDYDHLRTNRERGCFAFEMRGSTVDFCVDHGKEICAHNCSYAVKRDEDRMWEEYFKEKSFKS